MFGRMRLYAVEQTANGWVVPDTVYVWARSGRQAIAFQRESLPTYIHIVAVRRATEREIAAWPRVIR